MIPGAAALTALLLAAPPAVRYDAPVKCVDLEPGVFLPAPTYAALDAEVRRLQDAEHALTAKNASLVLQLAERQVSHDIPVIILVALGSALLAGGAVYMATR